MRGVVPDAPGMDELDVLAGCGGVLVVFTDSERTGARGGVAVAFAEVREKAGGPIGLGLVGVDSGVVVA